MPFTFPPENPARGGIQQRYLEGDGAWDYLGSSKGFLLLTLIYYFSINRFLHHRRSMNLALCRFIDEPKITAILGRSINRTSQFVSKS